MRSSSDGRSVLGGAWSWRRKRVTVAAKDVAATALENGRLYRQLHFKAVELERLRMRHVSNGIVPAPPAVPVAGSTWAGWANAGDSTMIPTATG